MHNAVTTAGDAWEHDKYLLKQLDAEVAQTHIVFHGETRSDYGIAVTIRPKKNKDGSVTNIAIVMFSQDSRCGG
jgi:hypothetical protein